MTARAKMIEALAEAISAGFVQHQHTTEIAAAVLELVKPKRLVWEDYPVVDGPVISMSVSHTGTYFICDDTDDFTGLYCELVHQKEAEWWGDIKAKTTVVCSHQHVDDHTELQAAAQAHADAAWLSSIPLGDIIG